MIAWNRVEELIGEVGEEDFAEVVELFLAEVSETIEGLDALGDGAARSEALHFLKGSAANLGFEALRELCAEAEAMARAGGGATGDLIARIGSTFEASRADLAARRGGA